MVCYCMSCYIIFFYRRAQYIIHIMFYHLSTKPMSCYATRCNIMQMQCNATQHHVIQCHAMQRNATPCSAMPCSGTQRSATQHNAMQCNAMHLHMSVRTCIGISWLIMIFGYVWGQFFSMRLAISWVSRVSPYSSPARIENHGGMGCGHQMWISYRVVPQFVSYKLLYKSNFIQFHFKNIGDISN